MSDDRLQKIEDKLDILITGQAELRGDVTDLKTGQAELRGGLEQVGQRLSKVEGRLSRVEEQVTKVDQRLSKVEVTQEQMHDDIKLLAEGHGATQDLVRRTADELLARFDERIDPIAKAVISHSAILAAQGPTLPSGQI